MYDVREISMKCWLNTTRNIRHLAYKQRLTALAPNPEAEDLLLGHFYHLFWQEALLIVSKVLSLQMLLGSW